MVAAPKASAAGKAEPAAAKTEVAPAAGEGGFAHPLMSLRSNIDRLFDDFTAAFWGMPFAHRATERQSLDGPLVPSADIADKGNAYEVTLEIPGIAEENLDITLSQDVLTVKGEKKSEREKKEKDYYLTERRFGSFTRSFRLPAGVDRAAIDARLQKGVLTIRLPKTEEARKAEKKIAIKSA